jgi:hypothetical protein
MDAAGGEAATGGGVDCARAAEGMAGAD